MKHLFGLSNEKGQSAVEFALVLPLLLILLLGIIEFGWFLNAKITITGAAREGARYYAIHGGETGSLSAVENVVANYLNPSVVKKDGSYTTPPPTKTTISGVEMAVVSVKGEVSGITGAFNSLMKVFFGGEVFNDNKVVMTSTASMRIEYSLTPTSP
ncbi:MAG: pilus assembly protein [Youngiibacter sp.]|nr:pilus assembly protein [Youngiibacter sp.]